MRELKHDVAMDDWSAEEWAWFICIFLYMISEHLPKVSKCCYTVMFHYKLHPVNPLEFGEQFVTEMADVAVDFSLDPKCCWSGFQSSWLHKGEQPASSLGPSASAPSRPTQPSFDVNGAMADAMKKMMFDRGIGYLPCPGIWSVTWPWYLTPRGIGRGQGSSWAPPSQITRQNRGSGISSERMTSG